MPITPANPVEGRQYSGDVILLAVRSYFRHAPADDHMAEMLAERGLGVDANYGWRWSRRMRQRSTSPVARI